MFGGLAARGAVEGWPIDETGRGVVECEVWHGVREGR